jgi:hypothetical protein
LPITDSEVGAIFAAAVASDVNLETNVLTLVENVNCPTVPGTGTYDYLASAVLEVLATPNSGYVFDHFLVDGLSNINNPCTVYMTASHTVEPIVTEAPTPPTASRGKLTVAYGLFMKPIQRGVAVRARSPDSPNGWKVLSYTYQNAKGYIAYSRLETNYTPAGPLPHLGATLYTFEEFQYLDRVRDPETGILFDVSERPVLYAEKGTILRACLLSEVVEGT